MSKLAFPTFEDAEASVVRDVDKATALERFIVMQEPDGAQAAAIWRSQLLSVVVEAKAPA